MAREKSKETRSSDGEGEPDDVKYGAAVVEIEQILASIDRDEIDLDELGAKVERAVDLLKVCRAKLKATEARVTQVLKDLAQEEADASEAAADAAEESEPAGDEGAGEADADAPKKRARRKKDDDEELPF